LLAIELVALSATETAVFARHQRVVGVQTERTI